MTKCENLMTLIPSNLYIHSSDPQETIHFSKLTIPNFLTHYIEDSIVKLIKKKYPTTAGEINPNHVYLYTNPFKMCYLTWLIPTDETPYHTITLGPLITEHLTTEEIHYFAYKMKLSSDNCFILESFYGIVPYFDKIQLIRIASMFLDYLSTEPHLPQLIREDHTMIHSEKPKSIENKFKPFDFVAENYATESKVLHAIEIGNIDYINTLMRKANSIDIIPPRFPSDPLREQKNIAITMNSISLRAALKGGLNQSIAHSLSHNFAILIEQQTSPDAIHDLTFKLLIAYTESVRKYALKNYSETVIHSVNYIRTHLTNKVSLSEIANHLHLSPEHLSRQFKSEMHMTISDFIHKTKTEESCHLLTSRAYSITNIAYIFSYSSPGHYAKMFKRFMHMSPTQWQKKNLTNR